MHRFTCAAAMSSITLVGVAHAHNYNNTRSNRTIAGPDIVTEWDSLAGVLLEVRDFDGDGFGGPIGSIAVDPNPGADFFTQEFPVLVAGRNVVVPIYPVNDRPSVGSTVTINSEEFGGAGMNLARLSDTVGRGSSGFAAETAADTMITDLGTSVSVTSDRLRLRSSTPSTFALDADISATFDLDLRPSETAFTGVVFSWSFGTAGPGGDVTLESGGTSVERDTLTGLDRTGVTPITVAAPGSIPEFQIDADVDYYLNVDVVTYAVIVPAPGAVGSIAVAGLFACVRRRRS
ncbi:MAG: hypothetical protein AAF747_10055 [Planctomycetota bacterium]